MGRPGEVSAGEGAIPARVRAFAEMPLIYGAMAGYAFASISLMAARQVGLTAGHAVLLGIVAFAATVRARPAVWEWLPFAFLLAMFQDLAAVAGAVSGIVHPALAIVIERGLLGGGIAASWLQQHLAGLPGMSAVATALVILYLMNDLVPLLLGVWLWQRHRHLFRPFVAAYVLVMSAGFLIYLVFPETPPWLAAHQALIPHVDRIVVQTLQQLGAGLGTLYAGADPEPNAAMPSIHVAIPTVVACMVLQQRGWRSSLFWLAAGYAASVCFGVIYLGEHYLADSAAGIVLGVGCHALASHAPALRRSAALARVSGGAGLRRLWRPAPGAPRTDTG